MVRDYLLMICIFILTTMLLLQRLMFKNLKRYSEGIQDIKNKIFNLGESVSKAESKDDVYFLILDYALRIVEKADRGSILIIEDDDKFHFKAVRGFSNEIYNVKFEKQDTFLYRCNRFKDITIINNPFDFNSKFVKRKSLEILSEIGAMNIEATLSSPIYIDEKLIGILNLDVNNKEKYFNEEDVKTIRYVKHEMELALKNFMIQDKLKYMASHDELTQLYNRRSFNHMVEKEMMDIREKRYVSCLALLDIDDFKYINDNYGHGIGDRALRIFSEKLIETTTEKDKCFRMSGDEFVVIFSNKSLKDSKEILENLRESIIGLELLPCSISFSYGIEVIHPEGGVSSEKILKMADNNMYFNKRLRKVKV
ncbi:sensor domain-containing diguanylate cyclase [Clostridium amazonitimonense]|uniref:sensor domain-containing diguanylate cyclase n=1 Tax=Clostridium amazonitimonense TaxID=1499689 RepID=UPI00050946D8|nr:sensor domain-containing diguanylate cyclase [Clostridium amazonitimonense]